MLEITNSQTRSAAISMEKISARLRREAAMVNYTSAKMKCGQRSLQRAAREAERQARQLEELSSAMRRYSNALDQCRQIYQRTDTELSQLPPLAIRRSVIQMVDLKVLQKLEKYDEEFRF